MIKDEKEKKYVLIILIAISFFISLVFNFFTPKIVDDFSFYIETSQGNLLKNIIEHYFSWGGSSISYILTSFSVHLPNIIFDVFNALSYTLLTLVICIHVLGKKRSISVSLFIVVNLLLWFLPPAWGQNFLWTNGSTAYSWTSIIILLFLLPFRCDIQIKSKPLLFIFMITLFLLGIFAGWTIQNSSVALIIMLILYFVNKIISKQKCHIWEVSGAIGTGIGFILLMIAPGNYKRMDAFADDRNFFVKLASRFFDISLNLIETLHICMLLFVILAVYFIVTKKYLSLKVPFAYFMGFLAAFYSMIMSPTFPDRAMLLGIIFFIIALLQLYHAIEKKSSLWQVLQITGIIYTCVFMFPVSVYRAARNIYSFDMKWKERIAYIEEEKKRGNLDIEVPIIKPINYHVSAYDLVDLSTDANDFPNTSVADYFKLDSIKGF